MPHPRPDEARPVTVLVVDDDPDFRMLLRDIIETSGAHAAVAEAGDGAEALDWLARRGADLVYCDLEMPGLHGLEVLRRIRADANLRHVPVVLLTGVDDDATRRRALADGASGYVLKPAKADRLIPAVAQAVRRYAQPVPANT